MRSWLRTEAVGRASRLPSCYTVVHLFGLAYSSRWLFGVLYIAVSCSDMICTDDGRRGSGKVPFQSSLRAVRRAAQSAIGTPT